jgi:SAM-dependent methyltransferase
MQTEDYEYLHNLEENLWWFVGMEEITQTLFDQIFIEQKDRRILDAGCGTGGMLKLLQKYAGTEEVIGIDYVKTALDFCVKRKIEKLVQASATDLPFGDEIFDLVTSFDVIVQIPGAGADVQAIREMYRVLKPGGIAFVRVAAYNWMRSGHDEALATQRRYTLPEIVEKMEKNGFQILRATYANSFLFPVAFVRRQVLKRIGLADKGSDVKPLPENLQWLNRLMTGVLKKESAILKNKNGKLPFGLSAICIAQKQNNLSKS